MGGRERKDIHLSLSPELLHKAGKLPSDLRQIFKSSPTKKLPLFWPGCLCQTQKHLVNPSITGVGELCVCCIISVPLLKFLTSLSHSYMQTQTDTIGLGHAVASPQCVRSSAYLESICLLPSTETETVNFAAAPRLCPTGMEEKGKRRRVWEMVRRGGRKRGRYDNAQMG